MKRRRPRIAVVGSLNVDFTFRIPRIPKPGETLTATGMEVHPGGKGANQALAAARAGAEVCLIGCVGDDVHGIRYGARLKQEGIETEMLLMVDGPTGSAFIAVDERGDNSIIVHPGANACLSIEHIDRCASVLSDADAVLLQLECPLPAVAHAAALARAAGVRVIVNPSPFAAEAVHALRGADVWIVNQAEFNGLREARGAENYAGEEALLDYLGCKVLVITKGGDATVLLTTGGKTLHPPPQVAPVDTVGAGDTFAGAFAVFLSELRPLEESVRLANIAGALATLTQGAQSSIPSRTMIEHTRAGGFSGVAP
jgi:ribokinase